MNGQDQAVQEVASWLSLLVGAAVGLAIGAVAAFVLSVALRAVTRRSEVAHLILRRTRAPFVWTMAWWGAWAGIGVEMARQSESRRMPGGADIVQHVLLITAIMVTTWLVYAATWIIQDAADVRQNADEGRSRRFRTQAQVLRRFTQAVVVVVGVLVAALTFQGARAAIASILASAGLLSVVAGLAAQSTLGNVFAGLQLAFTDAIRVGDVVVVGADGDMGTVEEITLTYVVVRLWDERRMLVPSSTFTTGSFENWTRRAPRMLGTVELELDWTAPMDRIRQQVEKLVLASDLWDGRMWNVQMTDSVGGNVTVRIMVSARDSGALWDLRCYLRERLIAWIVQNAPWALPRTRYVRQEVETVREDRSQEELARLRREISDIAGPSTTQLSRSARVEEAGGPDSAAAGAAAPERGAASTPARPAAKSVPASAPLTPARPPAAADEGAISDAAHAARLAAARRKAARARRRAIALRVREIDQAHAAPSGPQEQRTRVFSPQERAAISREYGVRSAGEPEGPEHTRVLPAARPPASADEPAAPPAPPRGRSAPSEPSPGASAPGDDATTTVTRLSAERLFSGSPEAEERAKMWHGPGEQALREREEALREQQDPADAAARSEKEQDRPSEDGSEDRGRRG